MRTEINKLHKDLNTTFIYVTHDQTEAMTLGDRIVVMNKGVIQQVDTPVNLYNNPINEFVAGFIGSPRINIINMELKKEGSQIEGCIGDQKITIPEMLSKKLKDYDKNSVNIATRPEHIYIENYTEEVIHLDTKVEVVESLGSEKVVYTSCENNEIIIRDFMNLDYELGSTLEVYLNAKKSFLFDPETGNKIS